MSAAECACALARRIFTANSLSRTSVPTNSVASISRPIQEPRMSSASQPMQALSTPQKFVELERYCSRCQDCWPLTSEFWGQSPKTADGFRTICKACVLEQQKKVKCSLEPEVYSKPCSTCKKIKPVNSVCFLPMEGCRDGYSGQCRTCANKQRVKRIADKKSGANAPKPFVPTRRTKYKVCNCCKIEKPRVPEFWHRNAGKVDGLLNQCKECTNAARKLRRVYPELKLVLVKPEDRASKKPRRPPPKRRFTEVFSEKSCNGCSITKPLTPEFWYKSRSPAHGDGWMTRCKICESNAQKEARRKRREAAENSLKGQDNAAA